MSYLYELHCHTAEVSGCGKIPAAEVVSLLKENEYHGVVITDHLTPNDIDKYDNNIKWKKFVDSFLHGYHSAKQAAIGLNFDVLLGAEIRFPQNNNDYLLYGLTEEFLYNNAYINHLSLNEFSKIAAAENIVIIQAHPMRNGMTIVNPDFIEGYEVYNGNARHDSRNNIAFMLSQHFNKIVTSGSDFHQYEDLARGGIFTDIRITDATQLPSLLRSGDYELKCTP